MPNYYSITEEKKGTEESLTAKEPAKLSYKITHTKVVFPPVNVTGEEISQEDEARFYEKMLKSSLLP